MVGSRVPVPNDSASEQNLVAAQRDKDASVIHELVGFEKTEMRLAREHLREQSKIYPRGSVLRCAKKAIDYGGRHFCICFA